MTAFTVFWSHPIYRQSHYICDAPTARSAGDAAAQELPEIFVDDDDQDDLDKSIVLADMDIEVWAGEHHTKPDDDPDFIFQ